MSEVIEQESTELVTLPPKESALSVYSVVGGLDPLIDQIRAKVAGTVYNMTTVKGRDECRGDAAKVAKSKAAIERLGKELSAQYKEIPKKIDAERKRAFDALEALQKQVRQPLTEWEQAEEARIAKHKDAVEWFRLRAEENRGLNSLELKANIDIAESRAVDESWEEFETEARRVKATALESLRAALAAREKHEAEQAELARLRIEAAERERKDREAEIARQAEERAHKEAEQAAQAERDAAAKREADAKAAADRRELELKLKAETAERERLEAIQRAEKERADAIERADREMKAAQERQEQAVEAERKRQADEAARIEAEAKAREANRTHKSNILRAAKEAIMIEGIDEDQAREVIRLIAMGGVPNVTIQY